MSKIRAIIFDLDDTLIHSRIDYVGVKRSLIRFLVDYGVEPHLLNENMPNLEIFRVAGESLRNKNLPEEFIRRVFEGAKAILDSYELKALEGVRLMEGALETLDALKRMGLKIGIVTNSCREYTIRVIEMFSLNKYVDAFITRDDVNNLKPAPEHLLKALEALGVSAHETVFVGDHWIDAICAERANVKFILLRNERWKFKETGTVIDDLMSLPAVIQSIS
ncbi:HAD-IA family hydrolase [Candidatus Bathyarchaeota archaeon]|nr:HAD-IA family hydrolase [Candidatus Bathyarchaeota archaeon]